MINLHIKQSWLEKSSESSLEEFKSVMAEMLNDHPSDRHIQNRWEITKISEGDVAHLIYDEQSIMTLKIENDLLVLQSSQDHLVRYDDIMYAIRLAAQRLSLSVYSAAHEGAKLPSVPWLALDHSLFERGKEYVDFFKNSQFIPRYCVERYEDVGNNTIAGSVNPPFYLEDKTNGSIHIVNEPMFRYLLGKTDQAINREFSYQVADSMNDFAKRHDFGLVPNNFYHNYGRSPKILNNTDFKIEDIDRKVFIDPYVWDFDAEHDNRFYQNVKNGLHLMDKIRKGEDLDTAIKRILREELEVADDYVGAVIWGLDFDRDKEALLTPRLQINVYVHGLVDKQKSQTHDWVSIK